VVEYPRKGTPLTYFYFVSYSYVPKGRMNQFGFGSTQISTDTPITDTRELCGALEKQLTANVDVVISPISFQLLRTE
jgi:hypothetical protein